MISGNAYALKVVATINPIHSLVSSVVGDSGEVSLLLRGNESPHNFQLKPSQVRKIRQADIVFYIADDFETFLQKSLNNLPENVNKVALGRSSNIDIFTSRKGKNWDVHGHAGEDSDHQHDDMHIWLAPKNAIK